VKYELKGHLMATCVINIRTKNKQNLTIFLQIAIDDVRDLFGDIL